ncbi:glycoside hydrolase family 13 protein [Paenibacillus cymbidii]|uniref:glycoside hydrolase family 13 protein n=1 Tax=Paenibacillus cymbidii TaxID=1639034 RepID=UPI001081FDEE|nr:glycoside hydrolase family 13 protein [Paenibacillus cymbidii]
MAGLILHEPTREYAYPLSRTRLAIRLRVSCGMASAGSCTVLHWNRNLGDSKHPARTPLACYARDDEFDYWEAVIETEKATRYVLYYFEVESAHGTLRKTYYGTGNGEPEGGFYEYCYTNEGEPFVVPDWVRGAVVYHAFPERFCNGNPANDPPGAAAWGSEPTRDNFMGGDLAGIASRVPYLYALGVTVLYMNPIFAAPSNHKYDTADYYAVDPQFGTMDDLRSLVRTCHELGIRVMLDGVFNHCGFEFPPFRDVLAKGRRSEYRDWFYADEFPLNPERLNYETIGYYALMPKVRLRHETARAYMLDVALYWLREAGIDGWRLDVAEEVDYTFWQDLRKAVKAVAPEALLLAETWKENRDLLRGDQMDTVTNYVFRDAVADFFAAGTIDAEAFDARINRMLGAYSLIAREILFNPLGSHDTARFLTLCGGERGRLMAAAAFQFCFPGVPVIYYGDEVGLDGGRDPGCRKAMEWDPQRQDAELLAWFRRLARLRAELPVLRSGSYASSYCSGSGYGFMREDEAGTADGGDPGATMRVYAVFNTGSAAVTLALPVKEAVGTQLHDRFADEGQAAVFPVAPLGLPEPGREHRNHDLYRWTGEVRVTLAPYQACLLTR